MDARELLAAEAAERWSSKVLRNRDGYDSDYVATAEFVRHALATVRTDDGEEATYEWARGLVGPGPLRRIYQGPKWIPTVRGRSLELGATRRQFRALCEALGIETKEVGS